MENEKNNIDFCFDYRVGMLMFISATFSMFVLPEILTKILESIF